MDDCDRASDREQAMRDDGLAEVRRKPSLLAVGFCHYCGEAVAPSHLFCDKDCASDWDYEQARKKANGVVGGRC